MIKSNERVSCCASDDDIDDVRCDNVFSTEMKDQRRTESGEDSAETLQEVFCKIRSVTGEDDLDVLVTKFIQGQLSYSDVDAHHPIWAYHTSVLHYHAIRTF